MPWYVARTKPRKEQQAAAMLRQRGVEAYLPILHKRKARSDRRHWEPLFPGYLFASLQVPSEQWFLARSAPGVAYFLGQQDGPSALPDDFMPALMTRVELANRLPRFKPGELVIIAHGPFLGMEAIFDRSLSPSGRSKVLVQLFQQLVPIVLLEEDLAKAV